MNRVAQVDSLHASYRLFAILAFGILCPALHAATKTVIIQDFAYSPQTITIQPGDIVKWTNNDSVVQSVASDAGVIPAFDTGDITANHSKTVTFNIAGTFPYHCTDHTFMQGTVIVQGPPTPAITSAGTAKGFVGVDFSYTITATGSPPITFSVPDLPPNLSLNGDTITGTFSVTGSVVVTLRADNNAGNDTKTLTITVTQPVAPTITSPQTADAVATVPFSYTITATGTQPITYTAPNLPSELALSGDTISGTFTIAGSVTLTLVATNAGGSDTVSLNVTVSPPPMPPSITSSLTVSAIQNIAFTYAITATGTTPMTYTVDTLPAGLKLTGDTISGKFKDIGAVTLNLHASNLAGVAENKLIVTVAPDISGKWIGSLKGKDFSDVTAEDASSTVKGTINSTLTVKASGGMTATVTLATAAGSKNYNLTGKYGAGSFWLSTTLTGGGSFVVSGHASKTGTSVKVTIIINDGDGGSEYSASMKPQP